jgi:hypothetical protein
VIPIVLIVWLGSILLGALWLVGGHRARLDARWDEANERASSGVAAQVEQYIAFASWTCPDCGDFGVAPTCDQRDHDRAAHALLCRFYATARERRLAK